LVFQAAFDTLAQQNRFRHQRAKPLRRNDHLGLCPIDPTKHFFDSTVRGDHNVHKQAE
jgi:hypothetical protein